MPVYNVEQWVEDALRSVVSQSFTDFECIMVDDGSTDRSGEICRRMAERDQRFRYLHQENAGPSSARNRALTQARGERILFLDSDDVLHPSALRSLHRVAERTGCEVVCCGYEKIINTSDLLSRNTYSENDERGDAHSHFNRPKGNGEVSVVGGYDAALQMFYQTSRIDTSAWGKLYAARLWRHLRFPEGKLYEDLGTVYKALLRSREVAYLHSALWGYRQTPGSIIQQFRLRRIDVLDITDEICRTLQADDRRMLRAATDRRLSAHFNILGLIAKHRDTLVDVSAQQLEEVERRCWRVIRRDRWSSLIDPHVRLKNRIGILLSFCGRRAYCAVASRYL